MKRQPIVFKSAALADAASRSRAWRLAVASRNENLDPGRSRCEERAQLGDYCIRSPLSETGDLAFSISVYTIQKVSASWRGHYLLHDLLTRVLYPLEAGRQR